MRFARGLAAVLAAALAPAALLADSPAAGGAGSPPPRSAAPRALASVRVLYRITGCRSRGAQAYRDGPRGRAVAIGFDDGPAADTPAFVRMLERSHARATFFLIGAHLGTSFRATLLRELRDGDSLGDHTFTHPDLLRAAAVRSQLATTIAAIRSLSGYTPCVFRPPYGAYDGAIVQTAGSLDLATVLWNVDPIDWARPGTQAIEQRVLDHVQPGSIILSHDGGGPREQTLAAYPAIIAGLRGRGYRILRSPNCSAFAPCTSPAYACVTVS